MTANANENLLEVRDLVTGFDTDAGRVVAVDGISFGVRKGATLGIVGESGCGKSVTALSIVRLLPQPMGKILGGEVRFQGENLVTAPPGRLMKIRGGRIGFIFQEPMTALNPVHRIGRQLGEVFLLHNPGMSRRDALRRSIDMLAKVGIPAPEIRAGEYPHQLSGGMRQRVVIAMALANHPDLVIADEPTTALDVTIQAQILELMRDLQREFGMSIMLITHDLGVIAGTCQDVIVMYAGKIVETGAVGQIFDRPCHPYTRGLLDSIPRLDNPRKSRLKTIDGMVPGLLELPPGCRFQNRCPRRTALCAQQQPALETIEPGHTVACHHWRAREPAPNPNAQ
ncbi:MAG: ABC transporter ATP-binding protein [Opitutaceae bacterium]|jgi:peptide/nickel transport system ATP-binding protein|nr:ABC transporter ATP-binding protein [Opitutaceae bacterium]